MRRRLLIFTQILVIGFLVVGVVLIGLVRPETVCYTNGKILTLNSNNAIAQAVAIRKGRILAVGTNEEVTGQLDRNVRKIDLQGKTMMPGIIDAHGHFPLTGIYSLAVDLNSPPIGKITNIPQLISALAEKAAHTKKGKWIFGLGYDDTLMSEKRHPTREDLDQASSEHPIVIFHISGHMGVANSLGLKSAGITAATENPEGAVIRKDPDTGEPTGVMEECAEEIFTPLLGISALDQIKIVRRAAIEYLEQGVTTAQNGNTDDSMLQNLYWASRFGIVPMRLVVWPGQDVGMKIVKGEIDPQKYKSDRFVVGAVKMFADGSTQAYTSYLREPFYTPFKGDPSYRGYPRTEREKLAEMVTTFHRAGLQVATHCNGDAAIDNFIYAFRQAQQENYRKDARPIIVHGQVMRQEHLDAMKELGMTPTYHLVHPFYWGDRHSNVFLGPERANILFPAKSTQARGIPFSIHLDSPVVPMEPMFLVWCAVNRLSRTGKVIGAEERISPMQALRAVTIEAAWQIFQENEIGSVEVGKRADLIVLSADPLEEPLEIRTIKVEKTIVDGKVMYERKS